MLNFAADNYLYPPSISLTSLFPQSFRFQPSLAEISSLFALPSAELPFLEQCPKCGVCLTSDLITKRNFSCLICSENLKNVKNINAIMNDAKGFKTEENAKSYFYVKKSIPIKKIEKCIVVCLDMSGSMNCTYFVDGKNKSRFIILLEELYQQLFELSKTDINVRLFIIGFNDNVKLYGDLISKKEEIILTGDILDNTNELQEKSKIVSSSLCLRTLSESLVEIKNLIDNAPKTAKEERKGNYRFKCEGKTALGPAIVAALGVIEGLNLHMNEVLILTDGMANAHLGNIENWLNEKMEYEMSKLIYEENERKEANFKQEPNMKFYQDIANTGNSLKTIFYFFGFQDQEILVAVLLDLILKSKNGSFFKIPVSNENSNDPKILGASLENFRNKLKKALSMTKVIGYDGVLTTFTKNLIAIDANILKLKDIKEKQDINLIKKLILKMEIICKRNSINLFYNYFEKSPVSLFFHNEFKFFKYQKNEIHEVTLIFENSIKPFLDTNFYGTGLKMNLIREIFLESDLTKHRNLLIDLLILSHKVCLYEKTNEKPILDFLRDLKENKSICFEKKELKELIAQAQSQKIEEEKIYKKALDDEKTQSSNKKKSYFFGEDSKNEEETLTGKRKFFNPNEEEKTDNKKKNFLFKEKETKNSRLEVIDRNKEREKEEEVNDSEDENIQKRKKISRVIVEEKRLFEIKETDSSIKNSDNDEETLKRSRRIRKRV